MNLDENILCLNVLQNLIDDEIGLATTSQSGVVDDCDNSNDVDNEDEDGVIDVNEESNRNERFKGINIINQNWLVDKKELKSNTELTKF